MVRRAAECHVRGACLLLACWGTRRAGASPFARGVHRPGGASCPGCGLSGRVTCVGSAHFASGGGSLPDKAIIFEVDGTLVDTHVLRARAWQEALARYGRQVRLPRVLAQMARNGDQFLSVFL